MVTVVSATVAMLVSELVYVKGSGLREKGAGMLKLPPSEKVGFGMLKSAISGIMMALQHGAMPRRRRAPRITVLDHPMPPPAIFPFPLMF
jgi:hypothetical protein